MSEYEKRCPVCSTKITRVPRIVVKGYWEYCKNCNKKLQDLKAKPAVKKETLNGWKPGSKFTSEQEFYD